VNGVLTVVEDEAKAVRMVFDMKRNGATYKQICEALNQAGMVNKSGTKFSISTVQVILGNENLYKGMYRYGKSDEWVKGVHEPILKED
jgi:hypothetical protein